MKIKFLLLLTAVFSLLLTSCATHYHGGVRPVSPIPHTTTPDFPPVVVDNLQPNFSWKSEGVSETKYDIIIYTGVARSHGGLVIYEPGVEVYYREGIEGYSHHIEQPLEPEALYVWSVRTRNGSNVGPWSTYDFQRGINVVNVLFGTTAGEMHGENLWWAFRTPKR